jgi:hypothetical protein
MIPIPRLPMSPKALGAQVSGNGTLRWRYERKFICRGRSEGEVLALVRRHPAAFREVYPARWINNVYLDTASLHDYFDHVAGNSHRAKTRIRWYGALRGPITRPVLEQKIKRGLVSGKQAYDLPPLHLNGSIDPGVLATSFARAGLPELLRERLCHVQPVLINRYRRHYLQSADSRFRLTVDGQLEFHCARPGLGAPAGAGAANDLVVLELKFDAGHAEAAAVVTNALPFRMQRCSKYVLGVEQVHGVV